MKVVTSCPVATETETETTERVITECQDRIVILDAEILALEIKLHELTFSRVS